MSKNALITGASGGLGEEFARILAGKGYDLWLVARSEDKLDALGSSLQEEFKIKCTSIAVDLTSPDAIQIVKSHSPEQVDILINNAGFANFGDFKDIELQKELDLIQLNITALTALTKVFLPNMLARKSGKIMNVASTAAFFPGPLMATYYASKAYVLSFSQALFEECKGTGVTITAVCPGPTTTGFQNRADMGDSKLMKSGMMSAKDAAEIGVKGFLEGKAVVIIGSQNKFLCFITRFLPLSSLAGIIKNAQGRVTD